MQGMPHQLRAVIDGYLGEDPECLDDVALQELVVGLQRESSRLAAAQARALSVWDSRGLWASDRSRSASARLARDAGCSPAHAQAEVNRARKLRTMPASAAALANGDLSVDHIDVLARANHGLLTGLFAEGEQELIENTKGLRFNAFVRAVAYWKSLADDEVCEDEALRTKNNRFVTASRTTGGVIDVQGRLDPIGGEVFAAELTRLENIMFQADWADAKAIHGEAVKGDHLVRTHLQRRADALVEMAVRSSAMSPGSVPARPLFTVLVDYETFAGRVCELAKGTVISPGQAAEWLDQAHIERVVFDTPSRVIDVGRRARLFTGGLRRAIEVRDRHCTGRNCQVPADQCQVDHIIEWSAGGETTQANGRLLCAHHNRQRPGQHPPPPEDPDDPGPPPNPEDRDPNPDLELGRDRSHRADRIRAGRGSGPQGLARSQVSPSAEDGVDDPA